MLLHHLPLNIRPPRAILLAADIILLLIPTAVSAEARLFSGSEPPYGTVAVQSASGEHQIAAMCLSDYHSSADGSLLSLASGSGHDPELLDPFNTVILGSDIGEFAEDLDGPSQRRLLAFLLGFCGKAFALAEKSDFATSCLHLARLCVPVCGIAEPVASVTAAWMVLGGVRAASDTALFILSEECVRRSAAPSLDGRAALRLIERVASGDVLLSLGEQPAQYVVGPTRAALPDLMRSPPDEAGLRMTCLRALAPVCPRVNALIREASLLSPASPRRLDDSSSPIGAGLEAALPDGEGRIFLRGWVRDPMRLIASIVLSGPNGAVQLQPNELHWFHRSDLQKHFASAAFSDQGARTGFVAYVEDPCSGLSLQPTLALRLHSGARIEIRPVLRQPSPVAARAAVLSSVPPNEATDIMLDDCLGPAAASFHSRSLQARGEPELIQIGAPPLNPRVSIIVPLYRNLSFVRFQIAALARDSECRAAEFIVVLDSPEQRREVEHLLRGLHAMHAVSLTLLIMPRNLGYAAANNAGAACARAPALLLLNSDVRSGSRLLARRPLGCSRRAWRRRRRPEASVRRRIDPARGPVLSA